MRTKTILITGGAGFIGSHLCESLIAAGHKVICLDNLFSGSRANVAHLFKEKNFSFIKADIVEPVPALGKLGKIDEIYNLACPASPVWYQKDPVQTVRTTVLGTANMLELARKKKAKLLQASTSEVYGDPLEHPQKETYRGNVNPLGERSVYQESKRFGETLSNAFWRAHGIPAKIVRIFHTFGPRLSLNDGRVIPEFMRRCFAGEDLEVIRGGSSVRTFSYISDTIEGAWRVLLLGHPGESYNVGSREEITIDGLAKLFIKIFGGSSRIKFVEENAQKGFATTPQKTIPDLEKIERELGYKSKIPLEAGLFRLKEWYELYGNLSQK